MQRTFVIPFIKERSLSLAALVFCMAVPSLLSLFYFMGQSVRLDEAQSIWQVSRSYGDIFSTVAGDVHVPLYHLTLRTWLLLVGDSITAARALSLFAYLVSIPALYFLGRAAYDRPTALFATFLFSISPFMNWYANEARMYTLFTLLVIVNQYCYVRLMRREASDRLWAAYTLTALLGVFTHYFFFLNLLSQAVFFFMRRDLFLPGSLERFRLCAIVVVGAFAPWAAFVLHLGIARFQEPVLTLPSSVDFFSAFSQFLFGFQTDHVNTIFLSLWPVAVVVGLLSLSRRRNLQDASQYLLTSALVSSIVAFAASFLIVPIFVSRYLIFTIPSCYLLLASLLASYPERLRTFATCSLSCLMLFMLFVEIVNPAAPVKENYAAAVRYLDESASAQDRIVLSAPFTIYPVQYYYRGPAAVVTLPIWNQYAYGPIPAFSSARLPQEVQQAVGQSEDVYLLLSYDQGYESDIKNYFDSHYQRVRAMAFSQDLTLYVYHLRYDTAASSMDR